MRDTTRRTPVPESLIASLLQVSADDIRDDPAWAVVPIAVQSNYERHIINQLQMGAFARQHDLPLVKWKRVLRGKAAETMTDDVLSELFDNEPGMWQDSVRGAPAALNSNIQSTKFLTNGAAGYMHSLSFHAA